MGRFVAIPGDGWRLRGGRPNNRHVTATAPRVTVRVFSLSLDFSDLPSRAHKKILNLCQVIGRGAKFLATLDCSIGHCTTSTVHNFGQQDRKARRREVMMRTRRVTGRLFSRKWSEVVKLCSVIDRPTKMTRLVLVREREREVRDPRR